MAGMYKIGDVITLSKVTYLYELFGLSGEAFYVGITHTPENRLAQHRSAKSGDSPLRHRIITDPPSMRIIGVFLDRTNAENAELETIKSNPRLLNQVGLEDHFRHCPILNRMVRRTEALSPEPG